MPKLSRAILGTMLVALVSVGAPVPSASQSMSGALSIEGDAVERIGESTPDATAQVVAGADGVYRREVGGDWRRSGESPAAGRIVFAAGDPDLALNGDHAPCLRGGESTPLSRTEDGGATWTAVEGMADVRPLAIWSETGVALGSSCGGFMLSTDRGVTWSGFDAAEQGFEITAFAAVADGSGSEGATVLFGETSEGGSSRLRTLDLADPTAPIVSGGLRDYYGLGALAGSGDTFVLAAIDGVWISHDAGLAWERNANGLDDVVLDEDPAQVGLPADVIMDEVGLFSIAFVPGTADGLVVGTAIGVFRTEATDSAWSRLDRFDGPVDQVAARDGDERLLVASNERVVEIRLDGADGVGQ